MLPETSEHRLSAEEDRVVGNATRCGNYAMEHFINAILINGGKRKNLDVKLFGGGKIIPTLGETEQINIDFGLEYIDTEAFRLVPQDLGGYISKESQLFSSQWKGQNEKNQRFT